MFLDVSQAFNMVWLSGLLHKVSSYLPREDIKLLQSFLSSKRFFVHYGELTSEFKAIKAGVLQGSVLGPYLYLLYTTDSPVPLNSNITIATFADNTSVIAIYEDYKVVVSQLQQQLIKSTAGAKGRKLNESREKCLS